MLTGYDPTAICPLWEKSILEWCCGDQAQVEFLQQWAGYCLSGLTTFQGLLFLVGDGKNGKSVFVQVLTTLLKDYALGMNSESLMLRTKGSGASSDIARLAGARLVISHEMPEGKVFDENLIKQMTGGDKMTARHLYQAEFDFIPTLKLLISGNHKPVVKGSDFGFWRRIHLVPFEANIEKPDPHLTSKLLAELPGILNWCIEGWKNCNKGELVIPQSVKNHSAAYRDEMDLIKQWIDDCLQVSIGGEVSANSLYQSFKQWQIRNSFHTMTSNTFFRKLKDRLGNCKKKSDGNYYLGYSLKSFEYYYS